MKQITLLGVGLLCVLVLSGCKKEPPVAHFSVDKQTAKMDEEITFVNESEHADEFRWEFGDGKISTMENPKHAFSSAGDFTVKLKATSPVGADSTTMLVSITPDLTGFWLVKIIFHFGNFSYGIDGTADIKQNDDNTITGSWVMADSGGQQSIPFLSGSKLEGNSVILIWQPQFRLEGTVSPSATTMGGKIVGENQDGTWTGKKL